MLNHAMEKRGMNLEIKAEHRDMTHCRRSEIRLPSGKNAGMESSVSTMHFGVASGVKSAETHVSTGIQPVGASRSGKPWATMQCSHIWLRAEQNGRALQCGESEIRCSNNRIPNLFVCKAHIANQPCDLVYPASTKAYSQNAQCRKIYYYVSNIRTRYRGPAVTNPDVQFPGAMWGGGA